MQPGIITLAIECLILAEGRGVAQNVRNDREDAVGILQIRPCVVQDLNRWGYPYKLEDRWDPQLSRSMCRMYLTWYVRHAENSAGRELTLEEVCKIWNGGPTAWRKNNKMLRGYVALCQQYRKQAEGNIV